MPPTNKPNSVVATASETSVSLKSTLLPIAAGLLFISSVLNRYELKDHPSIAILLTSTAYSIIAYVATLHAIPTVIPMFIRRGLYGKDMNKPEPKPEVPEPMGVVVALVYIVTLFTFIPVPSMLHLWHGDELSFKERLDKHSSSGEPIATFPHDRLAEFLSALLSIVSMILLGFADDIFDLRWRHKLLLPTVASLPLLMVYFANFGVTSVVVPDFIRPILGISILDLGPLYYVYMSCLSIFLTNCINILAGVNGVEAAQSVVVAISILINDLYTIFFVHDARAMQSHVFSVCLLLPFVAVSLGLLRYNWYPSKVFVGDTYTYFAGVTFAVVGILGHFSKTVLLFFVPQIINFILSLPQLARIVPCPRHRLPRFDPSTGLLSASTAPLVNPSKLTLLIVNVYEKLGLAKVTRKEGKPVEVTNMTILSLILNWLGPLREDALVIRVIMVQIVSSLFAFYVRYGLARLVFAKDLR